MFSQYLYQDEHNFLAMRKFLLSSFANIIGILKRSKINFMILKTNCISVHRTCFMSENTITATLCIPRRTMLATAVSDGWASTIRFPTSKTIFFNSLQNTSVHQEQQCNLKLHHRRRHRRRRHHHHHHHHSFISYSHNYDSINIYRTINKLLKPALEGRMEGKRQRGRLRLGMIDDLWSEVRILREYEEESQGRERWRFWLWDLPWNENSWWWINKTHKSNCFEYRQPQGKYMPVIGTLCHIFLSLETSTQKWK